MMKFIKTFLRLTIILTFGLLCLSFAFILMLFPAVLVMYFKSFWLLFLYIPLFAIFGAYVELYGSRINDYNE